MGLAQLLSFTAIVAGLALAGCGGPRGSLTESALASGQTGAYRLSPGDKVKVNVFNEPDFSGEFQVSDAGSIAFPLIGEVPAAGASIAEFKSRLAARLRGNVVRNPQVSVDVSDYRPVNVLGEVRNSGQYAFRPGLTVQDAIAMAGGYTYRANTRTVYIRRANAGGEVTARADGELVAVKPGDTVRVPQRYF
jgi:polysaccharide export outer membrane protein